MLPNSSPTLGANSVCPGTWNIYIFDPHSLQWRPIGGVSSRATYLPDRLPSPISPRAAILPSLERREGQLMPWPFWTSDDCDDETRDYLNNNVRRA